MRIFLFFLLFTTKVNTQSSEVYKIDYKIDSEVFDTEREITLYLPPAYYEDTLENYMVTYILDGQYDPFVDIGVKIIEYLTHNYKITPTIVVGVHSKQRGRDFSSKRAWDGAQAEQMMEHLKSEVIPALENGYVFKGVKEKLLPYRTLIGHSSGGTFVLDHLFSEYQDVFDAYVAISPGIREDYHYIFDDARSVLASNKMLNKMLYCSTGTVGDREKIFGRALDSLDQIFSQYKPSQLAYTRETLYGTGHWSCVPASFTNGMLAVTRNIRVDEFLYETFAKDKTKTMQEHLDGFYEEKEEVYGFSELIKARHIGLIAEDIFSEIDQGRSFEILDWALTKYPRNLDLLQKKCQLYIMSEQKEQARRSIREGREILLSQKTTLSERNYERYVNFYSQLETLLDKK